MNEKPKKYINRNKLLTSKQKKSFPYISLIEMTIYYIEKGRKKRESKYILS